jgi:hypothetical protein
MWKQKSRETKLTCKDLIAKYFHASIVMRIRANLIYCIKIDDGHLINSREDVESYFVNYFT